MADYNSIREAPVFNSESESDNSSPSRTSDNSTPSRSSDNSTPSRSSDNSTPSRSSDNSSPSRSSDNSTPSRSSDDSTPSRSSVNASPSRRSDVASSNNSPMPSPSRSTNDSYQSVNSFGDFVGGIRSGPTTSTQPALSPELFTDSMVSEYQRTNEREGTSLPTIPTPAPLPTFDWEERQSETPAEDFDESQSGFTIPIFAEMTEYDFWKIVFPENVLKHLVEETNKYASHIISNAVVKSRRQEKFKIISENEMQRYLVIRILMGIDNKPELAHYWSKDPILRSFMIPQIMSSDRFFEIQRYLHLCNDEEETEQEERDKLKKIRAIWEMSMEHFQSLVIPGRDISVDESLTKFKGRLSFKQFIPTKRNRFGVKSYSLVDEKTKFIVNSFIYVGKDGEVQFKYSKNEFGHGGAVLLGLCDPYFGENRRVFAYNYFTSPVVAAKLLEKKTYLCGTLRAGRKHTPPAPKLKKGQIVTYCCQKENQDIMLEYWRDKRIVRIISTGQAHNVSEVENARGLLKRKLTTITEYNKNARGTDQADMFIGYYDSARKTMKWTTKMFLYLELYIYNSFVMMRTYHSKKPFLEFRLNLSRQILESTGGVTFDKPKIAKPNFESLCEDRLSRRCVCPGKGTKRRCVVCAKNGKQSRTVFCCKNCEVPLCIIPCFEYYHTKKNLVIPEESIDE